MSAPVKPGGDRHWRLRGGGGAKDKTACGLLAAGVRWSRNDAHATCPACRERAGMPAFNAGGFDERAVTVRITYEVECADPACSMVLGAEHTRDAAREVRGEHVAWHRAQQDTSTSTEEAV